MAGSHLKRVLIRALMEPETVIADGQMVMAQSGAALQLEPTGDRHVMIIGGEKFTERHIWWNCVSSPKQRIEQAIQDWRDKRFGDVAGEAEFIPLPE